MKQLLTVVILSLFILPLCAQVKSNALSSELSGMTAGSDIRYLESDTIPKVIHIREKENPPKPALYLDGKKIDQNGLQVINPDMIADIKVVKNDEIGSIYVTLKEKYKATFVTLNELKAKYLDSVSGAVVFMTDGKIIEEEPDQYLVDEKYIMKIEVQHVNQKEEDLDFYIINLIKRTKENLDKANMIILR